MGGPSLTPENLLKGKKLGGGFKYFFYFHPIHPHLWTDDPI